MLQEDALFQTTGTTEDETARAWYRSGGLLIASEIPLDDLAARTEPGEADLVIARAGRSLADAFAAESRFVVSVGEIDTPWLEVRRGPSGYLARWPDQLDVLVPDDGKRILVHQRGVVADSIARLLLCQALSFVLAAHGREGMHASAVEIDGVAIVVCGDSGRGKSTLATALCGAGARLLADDLVALRVDGEHVFVETSTTKTWLAREIADDLVDGNHEEMHRIHKVAVTAGVAAEGPVPLGGLVFLEPSADGETSLSDPLGWRESVTGFLGALFNLVVRSPERSEAQFQIATHVAARVPVRRLRWSPGAHAARGVAEELVRVTRMHTEETIMTEMPKVTVPETGSGTNGAHHERRKLLESLRAAGLKNLPDDLDDEPLLRTSQVASLLRSSDRTVRTWADAGKLPYIRTLGGRRLFPASAVLSVLQSMHGDTHEEA